MTEEKSTPFYSRREFKYLTIACTALIVTAVGAVFYNKHPKPVRHKSGKVIEYEAPVAAGKVATENADSVNFTSQDSAKVADSSIVAVDK
ncbi:hypothetical protein HDC92_001093 [Pedobacter sp. AK017]|uniref:hypothetical protein n=1 Tax=Pedobacter sp. AK017 TaxID=2723073 RepID=UPI001615E851|nr:hypothetical protein [Pedobacter sp. AK017]MBB5437421.1 hypothetical protein [Pedobacter sp. AK017]